MVWWIPRSLVTLDSGVGVTLISPNLWSKLREADGNLSTQKMKNPALFEGVGGATSLVREELQLDFKFDTPGGPLVLRCVKCWVGTLPSGVGEVLLADEVMAQLGYDPVQLLVHVQRSQPVYDFADTVAPGPNIFPAGMVKEVDPSHEEKALQDLESRAYFPTSPEANYLSDPSVAEVLREQVA
ncbi:unnamed protein product [Phytophthora fragariaefolia]|uniref:Unnamed protein product n=1 Tax=Phytophthora fragariaefolia TaxID=1490495 RepID=A0A9W7CY50_9STRA|nr:unnamed protein product [Phytophthora fragariaefolia]